MATQKLFYAGGMVEGKGWEAYYELVTVNADGTCDVERRIEGNPEMFKPGVPVRTHFSYAEKHMKTLESRGIHEIDVSRW